MVPSHMPDMAPEQDTKYRPIIGYHILSQALALLQSENQWYPVMPDMAHNRIPSIGQPLVTIHWAKYWRY